MKLIQNKFMEEIFVNCEEILLSIQIKKEFLIFQEEKLKQLFKNIKNNSELLYCYILYGFDLIRSAYTPKYIHVAMECQLAVLFKKEITFEQLEAAIVFKNLLLFSMQKEEEDYLHDIYKGEASQRDMSNIKIKMHKLFNGYFEHEKIFYMQFVPDGYFRTETIKKRQKRYENEKKEFILFEQRWEKENNLNLDDCPIVLEEGKAMLCQKENTTQLYWNKTVNENEYHFFLCANAPSKKEIIHIANRISFLSF